MLILMSPTAQKYSSCSSFERMGLRLGLILWPRPAWNSEEISVLALGMCLCTYCAFCFLWQKNKEVISLTACVGLVWIWKTCLCGVSLGDLGDPELNPCFSAGRLAAGIPWAWSQFLEMSLYGTVIMVSDINRPGRRMPKASLGLFRVTPLSCVTLTPSASFSGGPGCILNPHRICYRDQRMESAWPRTEVCMLVKIQPSHWLSWSYNDPGGLATIFAVNYGYHTSWLWWYLLLNK